MKAAFGGVRVPRIEGRGFQEGTSRLLPHFLHLPDAEMGFEMIGAFVVIFEVILTEILAADDARGGQTFHPSHFVSGAFAVLPGEDGLIIRGKDFCQDYFEDYYEC